MRKNISQQHFKGNDGRIYLDGDWFNKGLPGNVTLGHNFYISNTVGCQRIASIKPGCFTIGNEVGLYDQFAIEIGTNGSLAIGDFSIINSARIYVTEKVSIGSHCMISWGTVLTDSWTTSKEGRKAALRAMLKNPEIPQIMEYAAPITLKDNVWIGFGCVIMPGVTIGEGAIVSSKTVVDRDVESYTIVAGSPMHVVKKLK